MVFKYIWLKTTRQKKTLLSIITIVFPLTVLCTIILNLQLGTDMEKLIADHIPMKTEIVNNHFFTNQYYKMIDKNTVYYNSRAEYFDYFNDVLSELKHISSSGRIVFSNYNVCFYANCEESTLGLVNCYGVNNTAFFDRYSLSLIDGCFFSDSDIQNGVEKTVVSKNIKVIDNGTERQVKIGDRLNICEELTITVSGIYEETEKYYEEKMNAFRNTNVCFIPEALAEEIVNEYALNDGYIFNPNIDGIMLETNDYNEYLRLQDQVENMFEKIKQYAKAHLLPEPGFSLVQQNTEMILLAISRIKTFYSIIFSFLVFMLLLVFCSSMIQIMHKNNKEIALFFSIGETRRKVAVMYMSCYVTYVLFLAILSMPVGIAASRRLSAIILERIHSVDSELLSYSNSNIGTLPDINVGSISISGSTMLKTSLILLSSLSCVVCLIIIMHTVSLSDQKIRYILARKDN